MDPVVGGIVVGVISAVGAIIVAVIHRFRTENRTDHDHVVSVLDGIKNAVERTAINVVRLDLKLDRHLLDHEKGDTDGRVGRRDTQPQHNA